MNTKLGKVAKVILSKDRSLTRYEAAEIAQQILKAFGGNLKKSLERAENPYTINNRPAW